MHVIAIDGPAGSGKSTLARAIAARTGLDYLDTGAMYRSVTLAVIRQGIDPADAKAIAAIAAHVPVDSTDAIRTAEVSALVSTVAAHPEVREHLVRRQREWAAERGGGVVEGRDIGTVVFPDAAVKVYLTAHEDERVRRRQVEGGDAVAAEVVRRDQVDSTRATSPLLAAGDAMVIDTTGRTVEEIVDEVLAHASAAGSG